MATQTFFTQTSEGKPGIKVVAEGYTEVKEVRKVSGFVRLADFASPNGCLILEANEWEKKNEGAVAYLEVSRGKEQTHPLHAIRKITFLGKSVVRWVDGNGEEQTSRILQAGSDPVLEEAYYPYSYRRISWEVEEGKEVPAYTA